MTSTHRPHTAVALCGLAAVVLCLPAAAQQPVFRPIAVHGDQAPGTTPGAIFFDSFFETNFPSTPSIDDAGNVSFHAVLAGPGIDPTLAGNSNTLYKHVDGGLVLIARQAEPAPGAAAGVLFEGFPIGLSPQAALIVGAHATFVAQLQGPGVTSTNNAGIWSDRSETLELLYRNDDPFPSGGPGATLKDLNSFNFKPDDQGRLTFNAAWRVPGAGSDPDLEGIFTERTGMLTPIVRGNDPATGVPGAFFGKGGQFAIGGALRSWDTDGASRVAFHGNLKGPAINDLNDEGLWIESAGGLALLIREGDPAPGFAPGGRIGIVSGIDAFGENFPLDVNVAGQLLFVARVDPPGASSFARVVYVLRGQGIELVADARGVSGAEPGPQAPGLPAGMYFLSYGWANLSNAGRVVLVASATNSGGSITRSGIWWDQPGALTKLAASGDQVPGFKQGVVYIGNFQIGPLAGDGVLLFAAVIGGPGLPNSVVIFLTDTSGQPHAVLVPGLQVNTAPPGATPDIRTLSGYLIGGMNESGEVVFKALFNDNTIAVMTVSLPTPCPTITIPPVSASVCHFGTAAFTLTAAGTGPFAYRWQIEAAPPGSNVWIDLSDGPLPPATGSAATAAGSATDTLSITSTDLAAAARYRCRVSNSCGSVNSDAATLIVFPTGAGDVNGDGVVDGGDVNAFVAFVLTGGAPGADFCAADLSHDGVVSAADVPPFVATLLAG